MLWGKPTYGGVRYDLTHLDPHIIHAPSAGATTRVRIRFGSHVFTKKWESAHPEDMKVMDGAQPRCFCPLRYGHSVHLPAIIANGVGGRVLFDPGRKLAMVGNPPGIVDLYGIFFVLKPVERRPFHLDMMVVSAHERPRMKATLGMPFGDLAALIAGGGGIQWPKK